MSTATVGLQTECIGATTAAVADPQVAAATTANIVVKVVAATASTTAVTVEEVASGPT